MKKEVVGSEVADKENVSGNGMESITDRGTIKLNDSVLVSIVKTAACETPGVIRMDTGGTFFESVAYIMGHNKARNLAIKTQIDKEKVNVSLSIIVSYGKNIPQLAHEVQLNINRKIKELTGLDTGKVDVVVSGIEDNG